MIQSKGAYAATRALITTLVCLWAIASVSADAHDRLYDPALPHPLAYGPRDAPRWLAPILERLRPANDETARIREHVLFRRQGQPTYLALIWNREPVTSYERFELYRVNLQDRRNPRLDLVLNDPDGYFRFRQPTADNAFRDGVPHLFLEWGYGGTEASNEGLRVLRLAVNVEDITPARPPVSGAVVRDPRSPVPAIAARDMRWKNMFYMCGSCGMMIPTFYVWRHDRYVPACRDFRRHYRRSITAARVTHARMRDYSAMSYYGSAAELALLLAQVGEIDQAQRIFSTALAQGPAYFARFRTDEYGLWSEARFLESRARVLEAVTPALVAARVHSRAQCPLLAYPETPPQRGDEEPMNPR